MKTILSLRAMVLVAVLASASAAWATDGYFPHGYGMKSLGMGGASVAMTDNAFAGANNPATAAYAGNRYELGVNLFSPKRSAVTANGSGGLMETQSDSQYFLVPEFGYNRVLDAKTSFGVTVYGNGGMNTNYPLPLMGGAGRTGVDLMQLIVAPTLAYKMSEQQSLGVSPLLVYQKFKAEGLQAFGLTPNKGSDSSTGFGVRLGYFAQLPNHMNFGASYSPKINMGKLDKYAGLFVNQGDFDIPANAAIGLSMQATPAIKWAIDYQRIQYSKVPAIANASQNILACNNGAGDLTKCLGASNGPGFGWSDVNVLKLGVEWVYSAKTTLRVGYNHSSNPVHAADVSFNILAPAVMTRHYTLGGTYMLAKDAELTWAYMFAPKNAVSGDSLFATMNGMAGAWKDTVSMSQQSLGVQYGWKF